MKSNKYSSPSTDDTAETNPQCTGRRQCRVTLFLLIIFIGGVSRLSLPCQHSAYGVLADLIIVKQRTGCGGALFSSGSIIFLSCSPPCKNTALFEERTSAFIRSGHGCTSAPRCPLSQNYSWYSRFHPDAGSQSRIPPPTHRLLLVPPGIFSCASESVRRPLLDFRRVVGIHGKHFPRDNIVI